MTKKTTKTTMKATALTLIAALTLASCSSEPAAVNENAGTQEWDVSAAPVATWTPVAGIAAPMSDNDGPANASPVPHGYSPSPQGAVLAAINGQIQMATANDTSWPQVSQYLLAPGEGRDQWAQARSLMSVEGEVENPAEFVGFKVADFSDSETTVVLATEWPGGELTAYPVQLTRMSETWRLVLPTQDNGVDMEIIENLDGFTRFSAEEN
ncbi:hypothetical protein [Corynebacterium sp. A21]|uniref:hypothetical protein n=1 Tax=Corynebacterium sp. A21 TaxID=3457318 RepID=UPI003FD02F3D